MVGWDLRLGTDSMCMTQRISAVSCCQATVVNKCMTTSKRQNQRKSPLYQGLTRFRSANFSLEADAGNGAFASAQAISMRLARFSATSETFAHPRKREARP